MKRHLPWIVLAVFAAWFLATLRPARDRDYAFTEFGRLPIVFKGRHQPIDSLARNSLIEIREKQTANLEPWKDDLDHPRMIPAIEWLTSVMTRPEEADDWPVFRVDHPELISMLKLPLKDQAQRSDGKHYSWNQISEGENFKLVEDAAKVADKKEAQVRTPFDRAVLRLFGAVRTYFSLKNSIQPQDSKDWAGELAQLEQLIPAGVAAAQASQAGQSHDTNALRALLAPVQRLNVMSQLDSALFVPPADPVKNPDGWARVSDAVMEHIHGEPLPGAVTAYAKISSAFRRGQIAEFNQAVADYQNSLAGTFAKDLSKGRAEQFFNRAAPFYIALVIYVVAFLLACGFWVNLAEWCRRSAFALVLLAFVIHTGGLIFRMLLEGRPPVTNLYSSAVFIGWGAVVLGMVLERTWRNGVGLVVASTIGFTTLIIAHHLSLAGDTLQMLQAVLDTNFWLATHVVVVTLGYASTFVAGFLGIMYVLLGVFTPRLHQSMTRGMAIATTLATGAVGGLHTGTAAAKATKQAVAEGEPTGRMLNRMAYGIICFATLFSFVGTVLGGIWADQSWGRFWGWDPKENGALIIVLWNALVLHARWGGLVRERGLMNLAIVGNIVTSWSWFGTNMLGVGLHSYGFMDKAFWWLLAFMGSQLALIAIGLIPQRHWRSFRGTAGPGAPHIPPSSQSPKRRRPEAVPA